MSVWQDISTAPKDGTRILLFTTHVADDYYDETFSCVQIGFWDFGNEKGAKLWRRKAEWCREKIGEPSHWMPLPNPPNSVPSQGETAPAVDHAPSQVAAAGASIPFAAMSPCGTAAPVLVSGRVDAGAVAILKWSSTTTLRVAASRLSQEHSSSSE